MERTEVGGQGAVLRIVRITIRRVGEIEMGNRRRPTHPGEVLRENVIKLLGLTVTEAAKRLRVTTKTLSALIRLRISADHNL